MRNINRIFILLITSLFLYGCNGDKVSDCLQSSGEMIRETLILPPFDMVTVYDNVKLVISQGPEQIVVLQTGKNLKPEISAVVEEGRLELRNSNNCNLFREYGLTTFFITTPGLNEVRSSTGYPISSEGTLAFNELTLYSESFINPEADTTDGSFDLQLDVQSINIVANGIAYFKLSGQAESASFNVAAGDTRIDASNMSTRHLSVNHRGTNDMLVNPQESLRGVIRGTGDVISYNQPTVVEVQQLYTGELKFVD